jgi:hypothetical protein
LNLGDKLILSQDTTVVNSTDKFAQDQTFSFSLDVSARARTRYEKNGPARAMATAAAAAARILSGTHFYCGMSSSIRTSCLL